MVMAHYLRGTRLTILKIGCVCRHFREIIKIRQRESDTSKREISQMVQYRAYNFKIFNRFTTYEKPLYKWWKGSLSKNTKLTIKVQ